MTVDPVLARRAAVAEICESAASKVIERVVTEATTAANVFGLDRERAKGYGEGITATLPRAFTALRMPDSPERDAEIDLLAADVRMVSDGNHISRIVERGLTAIAVRISREVVRRGAQPRGFTPDELEREFVAFANLLEARLFAS